MHAILWAFEVRPGSEAEFERAYAADGEWAQLFRRSAGYLGTELLRDAERRRHYSTIDRWESREAFAAFRRDNRVEYEALDARCAPMRVSERLLGRFDG